MKSYYAERRFVLRKLAKILRANADDYSRWILYDEDDAAKRVDEVTLRRRMEAIKSVIKDLEKRGVR